MRIAERRNAAAAAPKTTSPVAASSRPSDRGPRRCEALDGARGDVGGGEPFGVFATEGRSAACAGRTAEYAMATSPEDVDEGGGPSMTTIAVVVARRTAPELGDDDHTLARIDRRAKP